MISENNSNHLFPIREFSKTGAAQWGYINQKGDQVIDLKFDEAEVFSEGMAAIKINKRWGYINEIGKLVIEPQFDFVSSRGFSEGQAEVGIYLNKSKTKAEWNYINATGEFIFPKGFQHPSPFSQGWACVSNDEYFKNYFYINKNGETINQKIYYYAGNFSEGLAPAKDPETELYGFLNLKGEWHIEPEFKTARSFSEGLAGVSDLNNIFSFINHQKEICCTYPLPYLRASDCSDGLIVFPDKSNSFHKGYMDKTGKVIIQPQPGFGCDFHEGLVKFTVPGGDCGYANKKGEIVIKPILNGAESFKNGLAKVSPNYGKAAFGYIDKQGNWIWQPQKRFDEKFQNLSVLE